MKESLYAGALSVIAVLLGGGIFLVRAQRKKLEAEAKKTMSEAQSVEMETNVTAANAWRALYESIESRFTALEEKTAKIKAALDASNEDVLAAIRERHRCEEELDAVRDRLLTLEKNQRDRMKAEAAPTPEWPL